MLRGKMYDKFPEWKRMPGHKSLLIRGQRQAVCYSPYGIGKPMSRSIDRGPFRTYLSGTGTLAGIYGAGSVRAIPASDFSYSMGAAAENAVSAPLVKGGRKTACYHKTTSRKDWMPIPSPDADQGRSLSKWNPAGSLSAVRRSAG